LNKKFIRERGMSRRLFFLHFYYILLGIAVLSIPFTKLFYFFITPLLLILWIVEGDWKNKWNRLKAPPILIITCCFALFWFMNIVGLFYSNDLVKGFMRTYDKLPFLVYPLVFFTLDKTFFTEKRIHTLFKGFLCATIIMLLVNWGYVFTQYSLTGETGYFYYVNFSKFSGHPSYCALIVCVAFTIAFYFLTSSKSSILSILSIRQLKLTTMIFFFAVSIYFLQSRTGMLAFMVVVFFSVFYYLYAHKKTLWYGVGGILAILLFAVIITKLFPNRMEYYVEKMSVEQLQAKNILGLRSEIWEISYQLAMKHKMWGIGTGHDAESYLTVDEMEVFNKNHLFINAHNQFLQTLLDHGIFGLLFLVSLLICSFYFAIKTKNYLLLMLMTALIINIFFESMLERGHGIFTFTLFYGLFVVKNNIFANSENL